jgi:AcrR family transcriptional regulator
MPSDTREKILQAAFQVLSREGYENTSIKEIAEQAGVAQGLVHYYFKSKQQLVLAVLMSVCQQMDIYDGSQGQEGALAAFENFKRVLHDKRAVHSLYVELIGVGLHDPEVGAGIRNDISTNRGGVEAVARQVLAEREVDPTPARAIASAVWGAILGIIVQHLVDPEFNAEEAVDALAAMSLSAVYQSNAGAQAPRT